MYKLNAVGDNVTKISNGASISIYSSEYQEWIAEGNTPAPEFTDAEIAANAQAVINGDSLAYLASTDWYVTRFTESGVVVPADVTTARTAARTAIII